MLIKFGDASVGYDSYPDFKAMVAQLCPNGAQMFYKQASGTIISAYAFGLGSLRGEVPITIQTGLLVSSSSAQSNFLTDFPAATAMANDGGGPSPTVFV